MSLYFKAIIGLQIVSPEVWVYCGRQQTNQVKRLQFIHNWRPTYI